VAFWASPNPKLIFEPTRESAMSTEIIDRQHNVTIARDTASDSTPQYWAVSKPFFAPPRHGNAASFYIDGETMMKEVAAAIRSAQKFLLFVDWQMDYDVELVERANPDHPARFSQLIAEQLDKVPALEVRILLYDSVESPAYTHENEVRQFMERLNKDSERRRVQVAVQTPTTGRGWENFGFSHHQKLIVVDGRVAFIGGMDITYGRWCNGNFDVVADPYLHRINDMYNPGLAKGRELTDEERKLTAANLGRPLPGGGRNLPGFAEPYYLLTVLLSRVKNLWAEGRTWQQVVTFIEMLEVSNSLKKFLADQYKSLKQKLDAAAKIYNEYEAKKRKGAQKITQGQFLEGAKVYFGADIDLGRLALKHVGSKLDEMRKSVQETWEAGVENLEAAARDAKYYAEDPSRIVDDAKQAWDELKALPDFFAALHALEEGCQPRMPWQDIHARIEGAAVFDIYKNIARRWNLYYRMADNRSDGRKRQTTAMDKKFLTAMGGEAIFGSLTTPDGSGASVQIVRSMPLPMVKAEAANVANTYTGDIPATAGGHMKSVQEAMLNCIKAAQAYIYIETQFFISACGGSQKGEKSPATNTIGNALAERIATAIGSGKSFHVYVVLPVHPEGNLEAPAVAKQHYWILQSIKHGKQSLLRQVSKVLALKKKGSYTAKITEAEVQAELDGAGWQDYITFLNLRNWGQTVLFDREPKSAGDQAGERILTQEKGRFMITEQIYVHSKLMIVDDAVAIIGSANVNDRSLNGDGDSEIAAVIRDNDKTEGVDLGNGVPVTTRKFARELRTKLWRKHFGMDIDKEKFMRADRDGKDNTKSGLPAGKGLVHPPREAAKGIPDGVLMSKPASSTTATAIRKLALANAKIYEEVFRHTPRDGMRKFNQVGDCWPKRLSKSGLATDVLRKGAIAGGVAAKSPAAVAAASKIPNQQSAAADYGAQPPALTSKFMKGNDVGAKIQYDGKIHNVPAAKADLTALTGFFVLMPLDFGKDEKNDWLGGEKSNFLIAANGGEKGIPTHEEYEAKLTLDGVPGADNQGKTA
jgi:phosphatidylserine/phosphatidylglycerophosphate/cardiolipin synthase-like enzyme